MDGCWEHWNPNLADGLHLCNQFVKLYFVVLSYGNWFRIVCFVILLDMHSSSLNRGLLMAAMELLPTVYWKPPPQKKTLNNKKKLHTKDAGCFCLLLLLSDLLE